MLFLVHIFPIHSLSFIFLRWLLLIMSFTIRANITKAAIFTTSTARLSACWWVEVEYVFVDRQINFDIIECVAVGYGADQKKKQLMFHHFLM